MSQYNIQINTEDFFKLLDQSLKTGDKLILDLLCNTAKNSSRLCEEIIALQISATSQSGASTYFDNMLRSNRFEWLNVLLSHESMLGQIEKILKKNLNKLPKLDKSIRYFSELEYALKKYSIVSSEQDIEDSNFPKSLSEVFNKFSQVLLKIAETNQPLIHSFFNLNIERLLNDKSSTLVTKPAFFTYIMLFEKNTEALKEKQLINWKSRDSLGQNILFHVLDYPPDLINVIVSNMDKFDWECENDREKTPARRLAETDLTKYHYVKRLNYMIANNQINFENNDFRIMLKRTIKSYKLKTNSDKLNEEIKNTFIMLSSHPLINSNEGQIELKCLVDSEEVKMNDLRLAMLNHKLQNTLVDKPLKNKLKI